MECLGRDDQQGLFSFFISFFLLLLLLLAMPSLSLSLSLRMQLSSTQRRKRAAQNETKKNSLNKSTALGTRRRPRPFSAGLVLPPQRAAAAPRRAWNRCDDGAGAVGNCGRDEAQGQVEPEPPEPEFGVEKEQRRRRKPRQRLQLQQRLRLRRRGRYLFLLPRPDVWRVRQECRVV